MQSPVTITGIAGSLRADSYSKQILASIAALLPEGSKFETLDPGALPLYNQDEDGAATPASVAQARAQIGVSDALLIVTPEFNHGLPGVLKNALDWLSRPAFSSTILGKPVIFATHSPGALGGVRAQAQLRETLSSMLCQLIPLPEIAITNTGSKVINGKLADEPSLAFIKKNLDQFLSAIKPA